MPGAFLNPVVYLGFVLKLSQTKPVPKLQCTSWLSRDIQNLTCVCNVQMCTKHLVKQLDDTDNKT